jgi:hypothetical protein
LAEWVSNRLRYLDLRCGVPVEIDTLPLSLLDPRMGVSGDARSRFAGGTQAIDVTTRDVEIDTISYAAALPFLTLRADGCRPVYWSELI